MIYESAAEINDILQGVLGVSVLGVANEDYINPFLTSGKYMSHFKRVFSSPLG